MSFTPGFKLMTREQYAARVWFLLTEANDGKPVRMLTGDEERQAWELIDYARKVEVGPYDTACEIIDRIMS